MYMCFWVRVKMEACNSQKETLSVNFHDLGRGNSFLDKTPKAQAAQEKADTLNSK